MFIAWSQSFLLDFQIQILFTDYSGNKSTIEARLAKVVEIQDGLPEGASRLQQLEQHLVTKKDKIPVRAREVMERELNNLK